MYKFKHIIFGEKLDIDNDISYESVKKYFSLKELQEKSVNFQKIPIDDILFVLEKAGKLFTDINSEYYKKSIQYLPKLINYSSEMVEKGLYIMSSLLSKKFLISRLSCLKEYHCLDYFTPLKHEKYIRVIPIGTIAHIAAGNVFLGSIDSLLYGIITKNINILKVSSQDKIFPSLFFNALIEADVDNIITPFIALTYWNRENVNVKKYIKTNVDAILLFGGENSVLEYKNGLSAKCEMISFGPKISFALITKDIDEEEFKSIAKGLAKDIVLWEQRACTSCQNIFIEDTGKTEKFAEILYKELDILSKIFPQTNLDINSKVEIRKARELDRWKIFNENNILLEGENTLFTIVVSNSKDLIDSPLNRYIYINKIENYKEILDNNLDLMKYYMSTLSIATKNNYLQITEDFMRKGIMRFCKPGIMSESSNEEAPHDGVDIPLKLVKQINIEDLPIEKYDFDYLKQDFKNKIILSKINTVLSYSQNSEFYKEFYKNNQIPVSNLKEFESFPILKKKHLEEMGPPNSNSMLTDIAFGAYIFSAGGTTGSEKYVYYSREEFSKSKIYFGKGFKNIGINKEDSVANIFRAGAFWTAFPATNDGLEETNCKILSVTGNMSLTETLLLLEKFKPTAVFGVPGTIILLAEKVLSLNKKISIDKIYYAGEHLSIKSRKFLKKVFNTTKIASLGYAAVEVGPIAFQCEFCNINEFHVFEDYCYLEIDNNKEILITTLERTLHPLIKYKIGDRAEFIKKICDCGRTTRKFRLLSRSSDIVKFNSVELYLKDIDKVLEKYNELSAFYQIIVEQEKEKFFVTIKIETISEIFDTSDNPLMQKIKDDIINNSKEIKDNWDITSIKEIKIELLHPEEIERIGKTGKIRRIIDRRAEL